ncbi:protein mono-ADP-ribosyltransferase TIPARP-like isoform X2 [Hemicordylus capensis]|uniref:protein mono-ADP-ribosyltransferase TIPARP-like isoform X2 n=1 Tax=Hemicordylus capensis TaxID=884348 RepID=UPI0023020CBF|nr:protein mono-ADP-ribosyltransferase TIPARP-like isoform X2 [Hemicordylus capensis]
MGQHVSSSFIKHKSHTSSSPNLIHWGLHATKRETSTSSTVSPSSAGGNGVPTSPSPVPAKRNCCSAVDISPDHMALTERWIDKEGFKFHVHQKNGVRICDNFLLGNCPQGESCPLHHTRYPYHWQLKQKESRVWQSVSDLAQQHLEKLYTDITRVHTTLVDKQGISGILNCDLMRLKSFAPYDSIRRLSNTSSSQINPHFPTKWTWYWKDDYNWKEYDEPVPPDFLAVFEKSLPSDNAEIHRELSAMDLKQKSQKISHSCPIQHRPVYRSLLSMAPFLQTIRKKHSEELQLSTSGIPGEDPTDEYCGPYPATSVFQLVGPTDNGFLQLEMEPWESAYHSTYTLFHDSFSENEALVLGIYRIWNEVVWQNYTRKESMFECISGVKKCELEKHLFYGTWAERKSSICRMNFDPCLSGLFTPIYGQGIYFHMCAQQAHKYTLPDKDKLRYMFLAKVLVGNYISGEEHYRHTKKFLPAQETYESCVDNTESPKIFVTFNRNQCYPYFLICYKLLSDPVVLGI